jgi:hypothetical protein
VGEIHNFTRYLVLVFGLSIVLYIGGAWYAHVNWQELAPQFTANRPLNQKLLFLKNLWPVPQRATLVLGASMALNNFDSDRFMEVEGNPVINAGVNGINLVDVSHLFGELDKAFDIRDVILVTQFNELHDDEREQYSVSPNLFSRYVTGKMNWMEEFSYRDLFNTYDLLQNRVKYFHSRWDYGSSDFTRTGFVPLDVYGRHIDQRRWKGVGMTPGSSCERCVDTLLRMCQTVVKSDRSFVIVIPPISPYILAHRQDFAARYEDGKKQFRNANADCGGKLFIASDFANFSDSCFADFLHLNAEGARHLTDVFIGWLGKQPTNGAPVDCSQPQSAISDPSGRRLGVLDQSRAEIAPRNWEVFQ